MPRPTSRKKSGIPSSSNAFIEHAAKVGKTAPAETNDDGIELGVIPDPVRSDKRQRISIKEFQGKTYLFLQGQYENRDGNWITEKGKTTTIKSIGQVGLLIQILQKNESTILKKLPV